MKQTFAAEQFRDMYPCTVDQWFGRTKISQYNYEEMKSIIKSNQIKSNQSVRLGMWKFNVGHWLIPASNNYWS